MAAIIGILGESTTTTAASGGTTTDVYTVGASKAAKVRIGWYAKCNTGSTFEILVNGIVRFYTTTASSDYYTASGGAFATPSTIVPLVFQSADPKTTHIIAPIPVDFYLATGDIVQCRRTNSGSLAFLSSYVEVVGVQDDA